MTGPLAGRRALITGASSGIGAATAGRLAADGASVLLVGRRDAQLADVVDGIRARGGQADRLAVDLTDPAARADLPRVVADTLGGLDLLVSNAGVMSLGPVQDADADGWDAMIATNVTASFHVTRLLLPLLLGAGRPADLVVVSSLSASDPLPGRAVYAASKAAASAFAESLRRELAATPARVTVVEPGLVGTELRRDIPASTASRFPGDAAPVTPLAPADIADAIAYAVSRRAGVAVSTLVIRPSDQVG